MKAALELGDRESWLLIAIAALAAHASALSGGYIWLDHAHIEDGLALAKPDDWLSLFQTSFAGTGFYRPLTALSFSIDALISKTPQFFHAVTASWHAFAAVMTMVAGQRLGLTRRAALFAGLLFAVHPISSLVASAIAFRSEAMIAVALLALVTAHRGQNAKLAGLAVLTGGLCKETALVLAPLFVLVLEIDCRTRQPESSPAGSVAIRRLLAWEGSALGIALGLRILYAPDWRASFQELSFNEAIGTRFASFTKSVGSITVPINASICDAFPITALTAPSAIVGAGLLAGATYFAWRGGALVRLLLVSLLPALNLVPLTRFWSPHYLYLAVAFAAMLLARVADRYEPARIAWLGVSAILGALSFHAGYRYLDDTALWKPEVEAMPECREGHFFLAEVARMKGDLNGAASSYEQAVAQAPGYLAYADVGAALQNLGAIRLQQQDWQGAKAAFSGALAGVTNELERRKILHNLAVLALRTSDPAEAVRLLDPEAARSDALPESLFIRARALHELGREPEALELLQRLQRSKKP